MTLASEAFSLPSPLAKQKADSDLETTSASSRGSSPQPVQSASGKDSCTVVVRSTFLDVDDTLPLQHRFRKLRRAVTEPCQESFELGPEVYEPGKYSDEKEGRDDHAVTPIEGRGVRELLVEVAPRTDTFSRSESEQSSLSSFADDRTTVMIRNLPNNYSREMFLQMLDEHGFHARYDFVYLPFDFGRSANLGYAFVNLVSPADVAAFWRVFQGYSKWTLPTSKVCQVSWSGPHQGFEAHVARYRNSPVMHKSVPDEYKPVIFAEGERQEFPPATRRLKPPGRFVGR